ncbi:hypothetical protein [Virgisporangium aurantiacum]|uniref:Uncharacterized protein n=1 Tax=Virgisporangium aurantiacum TaxID=175570 RepID=A0A8J4E6M3_9ACTN|nr:hypothetical protein [Virgisporangium aurantiacum]GIJ64240.1 hypothetical protein Vau01_117560 [Virgisporangium aurantiacum]
MLAAGVAAALVIGIAVVFLRPADHPGVDAESAVTWLLSTERGSIGRTNALARGPVATTSVVPLSATGTATTVRRGSHVVVDDAGSDRATVLDVRTLRAVPITLAQRHLDTVDGQAVLIDRERKLVSWLDATGVPTSTVQLPDAPAERWVVARSALWLPLPRTGAVARVDRSGVTTIGRAFTPGGAPVLAALPDGIALTDPAAGTVVTLRGAGPDRRAVPARTSAEVSSLLVPPAGGYAVLVHGGSYTVVGLDSGRPAEERPLGPAGHRFGAAVVAGDRLFVADDTAGTVVVAPVASGAPAVVDVAGRGAALEVFAVGSRVWVNDPAGPDAVVFHEGATRHLVKYLRQTSAPPPSPPPSTSPPPSPPRSASPPTSPPPSRGPTSSRSSTTRTSEGGGGGGRRTPPPPTASPKRRETAQITSPRAGAGVSRCQPAGGTADIAPTSTLLLAHRRTSPKDNTYYLHYVDGTRKGGVKRTWNTVKFLGTAEDQYYDLILIIIDVDVARSLFRGREWITATSLPGIRADTVKVHQTSIDC